MALSTIFQLLQSRFLENKLQSLSIGVVVLFLIYIIGNEFVRSSVRIKGLPGPISYPLIGNIWDIRSNAAEKYRSWSRKYGGVYQIQLGNVPVVVVNTAAAAKAIFGQNSQALSSRPEFYTFHKVGFTIFFADM